MQKARYFGRKIWHVVKSLLGEAIPAALQYNFPAKKLQVYAITGTDGKTTSSTMLYEVLKQANYKVALISTVAAYIGDEEIDTGFHTTSPEPKQIQKILHRCVEAGIEHVVLEVTSHGIFQYRIWGIPIALAGITNISHEHLDYFVDWETYAGVKAQLLQKANKAVLNADDRSFAFVRQAVERSQTPFVTYSQDLADMPKTVREAVETRFPEPYNQWNARLVWTMAQELGVKNADYVAAIKKFSGIKGRMDFLDIGEEFQVVVDFAHTPNALDKALKALRKQTKKRLIAVYGSAGLRDRAKRPLMGKAGAENADLTVYTAEDPRTEDVNVIIRQMKEGIPEGAHDTVISIPDRKEAIFWALNEAKPGDIVGIFGKGHEQSMCFGTTEYPWSDHVAVKEWAEKKEKSEK
ncbi:UDP-N-acetylmuramoyl-L-alanyl-D-glutamate--2,6-diaminopimelate ligase [Candidatus Woesebacteria bacterium]|nr:UDP-N-acetylmuramoyl-L-alanyl-D-glutamate--2,6-diaminopimelate ligase [Candidatus Woesebacteria bacterium]MCD8506909.1 UDP-N-acetylmuramoyl-L-alanyl-D-glutamate--2,6-diaminopimelate ligase [Candidatus Woesebacteria bacterium]MCD8527473.1 UDP-N-acetylmuramoyl-L-alanyl-D-glutamate--2,6-diaminopimelate ligase [Candidatus Woesebacteria bacterium]MCD8546215.1 UDP-N-acetylmuramoyl-L-alanyl-D-glutamate--2,6-diaminopimelate ligase [Candidatus Woesebacteria bacterium]